MVENDEILDEDFDKWLMALPTELNSWLDKDYLNQIAKDLALTVRKEYRITVVKNVAKTTIRMSWKTILYVAFLMVANIII